MKFLQGKPSQKADFDLMSVTLEYLTLLGTSMG